MFELTKDRFLFPKDYPIKLFEAFSGIGCQRMGMNKYGLPYESVGISEIDKYALMSYEAIHGDCKNYGDIYKIKGKDLPPIDLFTFSFPCTDISKAGKQKGLDGTRSGSVYQVIRILKELKELGRLPKVLLMENVPDIFQKLFIKEFNTEIQLPLSEMGYTNYTECLNSKNYGVAQNRNRAFMVSVLGDYYYEFPKQFALEKKLKDYLEDDVDERYYVSSEVLKTFKKGSSDDGMVGTVDCGVFEINNRVYGTENSSFTLRAKQPDQKVLVFGNLNPSGQGMNGNVYGGDLSPTLTTNKGEGLKIVVGGGDYP